MESVNLLKELQLHEYYPQKLSFSEAIKLRGETHNGCPKNYGLEIVRRLLMFDSTTVISITTEINERLSHTETKGGQCAQGGIKQQQKGSVPLWWRYSNTEHRVLKVNPMDLLVAVMNCCDNFLRQILVEKMFENNLSIPILLPDVNNGPYTLLLFALRSLAWELRYRERDRSECFTDTLVDMKNPVVSFLRVGELKSRSKSKLLNELLNLNSFNTFYHRECANGYATRSVSIGSIEAAWFQSSKATKEELNCRLFTALNLRGDATDYPKQTQFLYQTSTLIVFMVDSFEPFKELYENFLKDVDESKAKTIVCYVSSESPDSVGVEYLEFLDDLRSRGVISEVKNDWLNSTTKISDADFTNDLRKGIFELLGQKHEASNRLPTYVDISRIGSKFGFLIDEDISDYKIGKSSVDEFIGLILSQSQDCKPIILPLQGESWKKLGMLEREQRGKPKNANQYEHFIADINSQIRCQKQKQCYSLIEQNKVTLKFALKFYCIQDKESLLYYLNCCKLKLDSRNRCIKSNATEEYEKWKKEKKADSSNEESRKAKRSETDFKIANSVIGLEHLLRELGQMYEVVFSEEIRMKAELKSITFPSDATRSFPTIMAGLLLMGQPLELMDGDTSNVPITWLKAVFDRLKITENNARIFVLSIIGVQSSGKSTLLNALFGLQCPVSAGRCTRGIFCHLVPIDRGTLNLEYDYVLVVDTEGLGSSQSTDLTRDNELATFAIGLADFAIINMKGENWSEMKDILQIVAYGLIRVRKTKKELKLMPGCVFVHQNVSAADAKEKNLLGQEDQIALLDTAVKVAAREVGFTDITKFDDVIMHDSSSDSWYFPDLWNGSPPNARVSKEYIAQANELWKFLLEFMKRSSSKLTISGFSYRISDLWNAILHDDFVCFRNTQEIHLSTVLNDKISHEIDNFKKLNKTDEEKILGKICSFVDFEVFRVEKENIQREVSDAIETNFKNTKEAWQGIINSIDIPEPLRIKCDNSLQSLKDEDLRRIEDSTSNAICVHMKKLEISTDYKVKELKDRLSKLEKDIEELELEKFNEPAAKEFGARWQCLIAENEVLVAKRLEHVTTKIQEAIRQTIEQLNVEGEMLLKNMDLCKPPSVSELPAVTFDDIVHDEAEESTNCKLSDISKANSLLEETRKKWVLQFTQRTGLEFDALHLKQIMFEVGQLLGILRTDQEVRAEGEKTCFRLLPVNRFKPDYINRFITVSYNYARSQSIENTKVFITKTDPLVDVGERYLKFVSCYHPMTTEANIYSVSKQIIDYAKSSFVRNLDQLIKEEVSSKDCKSLTLKTKRAFLTQILKDINPLNVERASFFKCLTLYIQMGESKDSEEFFLGVILKLLKEMLVNGNGSETVFYMLAVRKVGSIIEKIKVALMNAKEQCHECEKEYVRLFKSEMSNITKECFTEIASEIDFRIRTVSGFTEAVLEKIETLYADFLRQANPSFERLVRENNRAPIRALYEKIMGCRGRCPFCTAPCSQSTKFHVGCHNANHYPMGVGGTVEIWGLLYDTQETHAIAKEDEKKKRKLTINTCQTMIATDTDFRSEDTLKKYDKWYHRHFNWNYQAFKDYKEIADHEKWDIPHCQDQKASLYWKWFMAEFITELAEHYKALEPKIPKEWKTYTWEEAIGSLCEPGLNL